MRIKTDKKIILVLFSIFFQSLSFYFGKKAATSMAHVSLFQILMNSFYILSIISAVLQTFFWQLSLKYFDLSFVYPFNSLVYVFVLFLSYFLLNESITGKHLFGVFFMIIGVFVLLNGEKDLNK